MKYLFVLKIIYNKKYNCEIFIFAQMPFAKFNSIPAGFNLATIWV